MSIDNIGILLMIIVSGILILLLVIWAAREQDRAIRRAGKQGEQLVSNLIQDCLNSDDVLMTNVKISIDDKETELDFLIVNSYGIYVIEVKNYNGTLYGQEDDYEWTKTKVTDAGNIYERQVKNPIKQVKRQVYILSQFLAARGFRIWIDGYVFFVRNNSPVTSEYVLHDEEEIESTIHKGSAKIMDAVTKEKLIRALSSDGG